MKQQNQKEGAALPAQQPVAEIPADAVIAPRERLQALLQQEAAVERAPLGVGYKVGPDGKAQVVFRSPLTAESFKIPTACTEEEVSKLVDSALNVKETQLILFELSRAFKKSWPVLLEGGTAIGKTFAINLFCKLVYGPTIEVVDFYCDGQTDVSNIMGKPRPASRSAEQVAKIEKFLASDKGAALKAELIKETNGNYSIKELMDRAAVKLHQPVATGSFVFEDGRLPYAMKKGLPFHAQELGMAPAAIQGVFLKMRGDGGRLGRSLQLAENEGETVTAQPGFFMFFSTNPPGREYQERYEIEAALVRALHLVSLPDKLSDESLRYACKELFSAKKLPAAADGTVIDLRRHPELGSQLANVLSSFFIQYRDKIAVPEVGRLQRVFATFDQLIRLVDLVQTHQLPKDDHSGVDFIKTMRQAIYGVLIGQLQDKPSYFGAETTERADKDNKSLGKALMNGFEHLVGPEVDTVNFRGRELGPAQVIEILTQEAWDSYLQPSSSTKVREADALARSAFYNRTIADQLRVIIDMARSDSDTLVSDVLSALRPEDAAEVRKLMVEQDPSRPSNP